MKILAFETSCDDTSIALFENDTLLAMDTRSQIKTHEKTGGVVPEVAAREHANNIFFVLKNVLGEGNVALEDIDYIGVTVTPGLIPSLLTGITLAKMLSYMYNVPLIEVNHIHAHIFSNYLERKEEDIQYPLVCLTVSGGHNEIYHMKSKWDMEKIGGTTDDSAGEVFDKVAKMMGKGYPGGPIISSLAMEFNPGVEKSTPGLFPRVWLKKDEYDFSFSGLKSAVKREVDKRGILSELDKQEIAYEFENAVVEVLAYKLVNAAKKKGLKTVLLAGGVSANNKLNQEIGRLTLKENINFIAPVKKLYCMDNAAMVGIYTYYKIKEKLDF